MRRIPCVILPVLLLASIASAGPLVVCAPGTLQSYIDFGVDGCFIEDKLFFDFGLLTIPTGATEIAPDAISVLPLSVPLNPGLRFVLVASAGPEEFLDIRFAYAVAVLPGGSPILGASLAMTGSGATGDGAVTVIGDFCMGEEFLFDLCFASTATRILFDVGFDAQTSDSLSLPGLTLIGVANDIGVDGGLSGTATLSTVTNQFAEVPEPATGLLLMIALPGWLLLRRRQ